MAELHTFRPLFPGSSESDQLYKICSVIGTPSATQWAEGHKLASKLNFRWPQFVPTKLETLIPNAGKEAVELMMGMMSWDPSRRISCAKALQHPYFDATCASLNAQQQDASAMKVPAEQEQSTRTGSSKLPRMPVPPPKDFPANFMLNNLNGTGSRKDQKVGSKPNSGRSMEASRAGSRSNSFMAQGADLPPLRQASQQGSANPQNLNGSSRYLRMARYQPGTQQTPVLPTTGVSSMASAAQGKLPSLGPTPSFAGRGLGVHLP